MKFPLLSLLSSNIYIPHISIKQSGPFSANNLSTLTGEESITVKWTRPDQYKENYRFNVTSAGSSFITKNLMYNISPLDPGTRYNFSVTTETSDRTEGASRWISSCTSMIK